MNSTQALNAYRNVGNRSAVEDASPHHLISLLFEGALDRISAAKGALEHGSAEQQGEFIGKAISIIESMRATLDHEQGGEVARNLNDLYGYMEMRLLEARIDGDASKLDEVCTLVSEVKGGWDAIPADYR